MGNEKSFMFNYEQLSPEKVVELIIRYQSCDESEANDILDEFCKGTWRLVYKAGFDILGNENDAEEVAQTTLIKACNNLKKLKDPTTYGKWLTTIATNESLNLINSRSNHDNASYEDCIAGSEQENLGELEMLPESFIEEESSRELLWQILKEATNPDQFQTIWLFYHKHYSEKEIAEIMDCPEGTVKTRKSKGIEKARKAVSKYKDENKIVFSAVPFLTRFFMAQQNNLKIPPIPPLAFPAIGGTVGTAATSGTAATTAAAATAATAKAGFFSTVLGKVIIAVSAVAVVGTSIAVGITLFANRPEMPETTEETTVETEERETVAIAVTETTETLPSVTSTESRDLVETSISGNTSLSADQISEELIGTLFADASERYKDSLNDNLYKIEQINSIDYANLYVLTPKGSKSGVGGNAIDNYVIMVLHVNVTYEPGDTNEETYDYYWYVRYENVRVNADGSNDIDDITAATDVSNTFYPSDSTLYTDGGYFTEIELYDAVESNYADDFDIELLTPITKRFATSIDDITDGMINTLFEDASGVFTTNLNNNFYKIEQINSIELEGIYFIVPQDGVDDSGVNDVYNYIYIVLHVNVTNDPGDEYEETYDYYYYVRYRNIVVNEDGSNELTNMHVKSFSNKDFNPSDHWVNFCIEGGYITLQELYDEIEESYGQEYYVETT